MAMVELPEAVRGQVVTRFPPEPSGYLHIGHAKAALLNHYYAKHYEGTFLLRFDDTNPAKEKKEFENSITEDLHLLNITPDKVTHTSDYFDEMLSHMTKLVMEGSAYVDNTDAATLKTERMEGIESPCRAQTVEENLRLWKEMQEGTEEGQKCCVRLKLNMKDKNKCMRDPTMYRCVCQIPHHRQGLKYKVYPTYDFACPVVDSLEGVTHAMRTNEYSDRIPQYKKVLQLTGLRNVVIYEFSRLNFVRSVLSKRKLQWFVDQKLVDGWGDPRFPTVRGIIRRGLQVPALLEFLLEQGPSKSGNLMQWDKLWAKNKQLIDPVVPRYMAVEDATKVLLELSNGPSEPETKQRDLHPKDPAVGQTVQGFYKEVWLDRDDAEGIETDEEITLMRWGNAIIEERCKDAEGKKLTRLRGRLHLEGDFKKTKKKVHWLPNLEKPTKDFKGLTKCLLREYDHLIVPDKIEDTQTMEEVLNKESLFNTVALAEGAVATLPVGTLLQFERRGYFRVDHDGLSTKAGTCSQAVEVNGASKTSPVDGNLRSSESASTVLVKIPDGKSKAMSTVSVKVDAAKLAGTKSAKQKKKKKEHEGDHPKSLPTDG